MRESAAQVLAQTRSHLPGEGTWTFQSPRELGIVLGETERFERRLASGRVRADERELAKVRDEHQAIPSPVPAHLIDHGGGSHILVRGLDLYHAPFRYLTLPGTAPLHLPRRVKPKVRMARALVRQLPQRRTPSV